MREFRVVNKGHGEVVASKGEPSARFYIIHRSVRRCYRDIIYHDSVSRCSCAKPGQRNAVTSARCYPRWLERLQPGVARYLQPGGYSCT